VIKYKKYVKQEKTPCQLCCLEGKDECISAACAHGYMVEVKAKPTKRTRPRKSRDRRLLEALLLAVDVWADGEVTDKGLKWITEKQAKQLIAIKAKMKGGK
jgi:hypothetical protein